MSAATLRPIELIATLLGAGLVLESALLSVITSWTIYGWSADADDTFNCIVPLAAGGTCLLGAAISVVTRVLRHSRNVPVTL